MKIQTHFSFTLLAILLFSLTTFAQNSSAPTDKPHSLKGEKQLKHYDELIAPYVEKAQRTLPKAKKLYNKGLKDGEAFFLTTRIYDVLGNYEQIFVQVTSWEKGRVTGEIANELYAVKGYSYKQSINFPEDAILDWLISQPNGKEKGNYVGKFLDTLRQ